MNNDRDEAGRDLTRANTQTREQRRAEAEKDWRKYPIEKFELYKKEQGRLEADVDKMLTEIRKFERHLVDEINPESDLEIIGVRDAVKRDIESFRDEVLKQNSDLKNKTIENYLDFIQQFYNILSEHNAFVGNPVDQPLKQFRENHDLGSSRPYIEFDRMQTFLNWLTLPFSRCFWLSGIKHGSRASEAINVDLRCLHIDHPVFWEVIDNHDVRLDPRVRDRPDTMLIYGKFNKGDEIPNEDIPGPETEGEIRDAAAGNKRFEEGGSILPIDSEFKTALIQWLLARPPTYEHNINPLFVTGGSKEVNRIGYNGVRHRLWAKDSYSDSVQNFAAEQRVDDCPTCGSNVVEENLSRGEKTGRKFICQNCNRKYWRPIYWEGGLETSQKMGFHVARHYFTNLHQPGQTDLHDSGIKDKIRKERIRGDVPNNRDTEDDTYQDKVYENYDSDIRQPYLEGVATFDIYDEVIPAVGEGWET